MLTHLAVMRIDSVPCIHGTFCVSSIRDVHNILYTYGAKTIYHRLMYGWNTLPQICLSRLRLNLWDISTLDITEAVCDTVSLTG
jgi:hypothetical protein